MIFFSVFSILSFALTHVLSSVLEGLTYSKLDKKLRISIMEEIYHKQLLDVHKMHTAELFNRLTTDTATINNFFITVSKQICQVVLTCIFAIIYLFILNWKMAWMFLMVIPLLTGLTSLFAPVLQKATKQDMKNEDNNRVHMQETLNRLTLFQVYSMKNVITANTNALYQIKQKSKVKLSILQGIFAFLNSLISFSVFVIATGVGTYFVIKGENQVGDLVAMIQLTNYIILPLTAVPKWIALINRTFVSVQRIQEIEKFKDREILSSEHEQERTIIDKIILNCLFFRYNENDDFVIENATASFSKGSITGIVGESGAGKTTLLRLILGVYLPEKSEMIKVQCGEDIYSFVASEKSISYVPSDNFVFHATIKDNICMSRKFDKKEFRRACNFANIFDLIEGFNKQENEMIEENGNNLSMGQKQRIAIARALYRNTQVIVFDEPTANLDQKSTELFIKMLSGISEDKICIIVTHDMRLASFCNVIYKLSNKELNFTDLTLRGGIYEEEFS